MKRKKLFYIFFLLLIPLVHAKDILTTIFEPIGPVNFAGLYAKYWQIFDFTIYLILFLSVARFTFGKWYDKSQRAGKSISAAVGIALALSLTVWSAKNNFRLSNLGPFAAILLLLIVVILIYQLLKSFGMKLPYSAAWTFLLFYVILTAIFPTLYKWISDSAPLLAALISVAFLISLIFAILSLIKIFKSEEPEEGIWRETKENEEEEDDLKRKTERLKEKEAKGEKKKKKEKNELEKYIDGIISIGERYTAANYHSYGSFASDFISRPGELKLTKMKKYLESIEGAYQILKSKGAGNSEFEAQLEKAKELYADCFRDYKKIGNHLRSSLKAEGINPSKGENIKAYIDQKEEVELPSRLSEKVPNRPHNTIKRRMVTGKRREIRREIVFLLRAYNLFFRALKDMKEYAKQYV